MLPEDDHPIQRVEFQLLLPALPCAANPVKPTAINTSFRPKRKEQSENP